MYKRQQRKNNLIIAACMTAAVLLILAGIIGSAAAARQPWLHWSRQGSWQLMPLLVPLGAVFLAFGLYALIRNGMLRRNMRGYRVGEEELRHFEQEYLRGPRKRYEKVVLTDHWLYSRSVAATCLLPLREAAWIYGIYPPADGPGSGYTVGVHFSNGAVLRITCRRFTLDRAIGELAERCPQARFEEYTKERKHAWKERVKQWHSSQ